MSKLTKHYKLWYEWQKNCLNTWYYKLFVLFGFVVSPTFERHKFWAEFREKEKQNDTERCI